MRQRYIWQIGDRVGNSSVEGVVVGFTGLHPIIRTSPHSITTASQQVLEKVFGWRLIEMAGAELTDTLAGDGASRDSATGDASANRQGD